MPTKRHAVRREQQQLEVNPEILRHFVDILSSMEGCEILETTLNTDHAGVMRDRAGREVPICEHCAKYEEATDVLFFLCKAKPWEIGRVVADPVMSKPVSPSGEKAYDRWDVCMAALREQNNKYPDAWITTLIARNDNE